MLEQLDPLAKTALWTASMRAREHDRPDRLFDDPLARVLAGDEGPAIMHSFEAGVQGAVEDPALAVRTKFFDDALAQFSQSKDKHQIVLMAAGMDTRAFRMDWPARTTIYELDRAALLGLKDRLLTVSGAVPTCKRIAIGVDLIEDWQTPLIDSGFDQFSPTLWLIEGLFYFLTPGQRDALVSKVSGLSVRGSWLLADYVTQQHLDSPSMRAWRDEMARKDHAWQSGCDDPVSWLRVFGWSGTIKYYGEPEVSYGRWAGADVAPGVSGTRGRYLIVGERALTASSQ